MELRLIIQNQGDHCCLEVSSRVRADIRARARASIDVWFRARAIRVWAAALPSGHEKRVSLIGAANPHVCGLRKEHRRGPPHLRRLPKFADQLELYR